MALTNLSQIKGGSQLRLDVDGLLKSYDAAKVLTSVSKGEGKGVYNADELLAKLKADLAAVTGDGTGTGETLPEIKAAIDNINSKKIQDIVRLKLTATYANSAYTVALPSNLATLVPSLDTSVAVPVYSVDNKTVFDASGNQLTFNFATAALSGVPSVLDVEASKKTTDGSMVYKPLAATFEFKVFPTGHFTLDSIPENSLLDNQEMQLLAYDQAINKIIVELAKDEDLIAAVKAAIGEKAVQDQIKAATDAINTKVEAAQAAADSKVAKTDISTSIPTDGTAVDTKVASEKAVADAVAALKTDVSNASTNAITNQAERISALESMIAPVEEKFAISEATAKTSFALAKAPNNTLVKATINHMVYVEGDDFTVDRTAKTVTWTLTAANHGFDITPDLTDAVLFSYHTGEAVANTSTVTILHQDAIPTTGTYKVGDMVFRLTPVSTSNEGWICTKAGTPGEWMTFGVIDFEHTIYPTESAG